MSEESAFLEALKANPADDTVRLVYADWLDEHAEPAKAEYLRAVVDLTVHAGGTTEYTTAAVRLFNAVIPLDRDWQFAAGGRFDLFLTGFEPCKKVHTIKVIREITGHGLARAKALAESVPTPLDSWQPFELLFERLLAFQQVGNGISVDIRPTLWPNGAKPGTVFDVILTSHDFNLEVMSHIDVELSIIVGVGRHELVSQLRNLPMRLGSGIRPAALADFLRRVKMATNLIKPLPPDAIQIIPHTPS